MQAALAAHDQVLRSAIESHGGFMFKHTGDGGGRRRVRLAEICCRCSCSSTAGLGVTGGSLGLATGEAELRDGDYSGRCSPRFLSRRSATRPMARSSSTRVLCRPVTERYAIHGVTQAGRRAFHHAMFDADTDLSGADLAGADLSEICYESETQVAQWF